MKKIRILQTGIANTGSGITQYILNNWKNINHELFQFDFITYSDKLDFAEDLISQGCKIYYMKNRAENDKAAAREELRKVFSNGYDIIHLNTSYWKSLEMERLAKECNIRRIIVHSHNTGIYDESDREEKLAKHNLIRNSLTEDIATDYWACSKKAAEWLYGNNIPKDKIRIMNNAIDTERFSYNASVRDRCREQNGWENNILIGHIGRFSYQKNHEFIIDVFNKLSKLDSRYRLVLIGKGPKEQEIKELALEYNIDEKIKFLGYTDVPEKWMQAMDIFILPSHFEGLGLVLIEAQASGLPCFASDTVPKEADVTGLVEYIELCREDWVKKILTCNENFDRGKYCIKVEQSGYEIRKQIKVIEEAYMNI